MKKLFLLFAAALLAATCPAGVFAQFKIGGKKIDAGKLLNAGKDVAKAVTLNDEEIARLSRESVEWMDANNPVAADSTTYGARLKRLTEGITDADGLPLNFKVYLVTDVNAFACGDGSIRVFAALMVSRPEKGLHKKSKPYAENNEVRLIASLFTASVAEFDFTGVFERSQDVPPTLRRTWYSHVYDS